MQYVDESITSVNLRMDIHRKIKVAVNTLLITIKIYAKVLVSPFMFWKSEKEKILSVVS